MPFNRRETTRIFCRNFDFNPLTLTLELNLNILKTYMYTKNKVF